MKNHFIFWPPNIILKSLHEEEKNTCFYKQLNKQSRLTSGIAFSEESASVIFFLLILRFWDDFAIPHFARIVNIWRHVNATCEHVTSVVERRAFVVEMWLLGDDLTTAESPSMRQITSGNAVAFFWRRWTAQLNPIFWNKIIFFLCKIVILFSLFFFMFCFLVRQSTFNWGLVCRRVTIDCNQPPAVVAALAWPYWPCFISCSLGLRLSWKIRFC